MKGRHNVKVAKLILVITVMFFVVAGAGFLVGMNFIDNQLLTANKNLAVDIALLVKNNFHISDEEVKYMKTLTFNEMEVDEINMRLMNVGNGVELNTDIVNVYLIAPLTTEEIKYTTDKETADFFGYKVGEKLDGIWLLNGIIGDDGKFIPKQRDDIYRYTKLTGSQINGIENEKAYGEYSSDAWGDFITGYAPIYTTEGNYVGMLGIDMSPDKYQESAKKMIAVLVLAFLLISITMVALFLYFYFKYIKQKEGELYFEFYSRMSHDMRTPMNGILGMAALSKDEKDVDVLHRNFRMVEESGKYMLGLINDTLDIQKLDAGKLNLDPKIRNCNELVTGLVEMVRQEADKKSIEFKVVNKNFNLEHYSYVDELRVKQIFMNLASNAIKFTPEGGTVTFTIESLGEDDGVCHNRFSIADTGIGISRKFIDEHLFKPFEQEQNSVTTQYGGSGLGLSIVKNLVELMGGRIEVESEVGKGTTFIVYLDIPEVAKERAEKELKNIDDSSKKKLEDLNGKKILLCEDHPLNAEIARKLLEKYGCKVTTARNGAEGVKLFEESKTGEFNMILMDIRMPVMDGITATKEIRNLPREDAVTIPILAMTANAYDEDIRECLDAGMNGHISKPVNPDEMYKKIIDCIE